jgi:hypothetical protein
MLDENVNYIVSGLERSGTSLMMQMLHAGGLPIAFDEARPADEHNPRGYFELAGGKIISRLMDSSFDPATCDGQIVKVTAYGLQFLPEGRYKVIYMLRNIDEVLRSAARMGAPTEPSKDKPLLRKLNRVALALMDSRDDMEYITVKHADLMKNPREEMERVAQFLGKGFDLEQAIAAVDPKLYRSQSSD